MNVDELVDQISFGRQTARHGACLGLYLSPETIYIAETRLERGKIVVEHLVRIPVPAGAKPNASASTLNTDFLLDISKLAPLIRQSMSQIRWNSREVVVTLSHHLGLLRYFTMPAVERRFWRSAVPIEAKKYIPIPFDALSHDYQVIQLPPDAGNKPRIGALVGVTQRTNLSNVTGLLEALGLELAGMEIAPCSVLRMWEGLDKSSQGRTHCQVHFDGGNIRILVADRGLPVFFRELFLGGDAAVGDLRKIDLGGCVSFAQKQLGVGALAQLRVSGSTSNLAQWSDVFSSEIGIRAAVQDTPAMLGIKGGDWGGFAAIGASLRFVAPSPATLDLCRVGQITEEERRTARNILGLGALLAGYFIVSGLWGGISYKWHAAELRKFKRDPEIEAALAGKTQDEITELIRGMQAQVSAAGGLSADSPKVTAMLRDVVASLPDSVWLTGIEISNPVNRGDRGIFEVQLAGRAMAGSPGEEQQLVRRFRDNLLKTSLLAKIFPKIEISLTKNTDDAGGQGLEPQALQQRIEGRTLFTIRGRPGKSS